MSKETIIKAVKDALKKGKKRNFRESVELAINLRDVDLTLPKNRIDEDIILPHGRGRDVKVLIFGGGELAAKAKNVADTVITPEELEDLADKKRDAKKVANAHDYFIAEAPLMPVIGRKLGIVLGPRGKMPKPIAPGADPSGMVNNARKIVRARTKDKMTFHVPVGSRDMAPEQIAENIELVLSRVMTKLERGHFNIRSAYVKTTMGPSVKLEVQ